MNTEEKARQLMAQERQQEEHLKSNMLSRSVEEVETQSTEDIGEQARELMTRERQHNKHIEENMLSRSTEEIQ
jgi:hypothetical protein